MNRTIRNIKKRRELAQMVYDQYYGGESNLTQLEKEARESEVYAAFQGYTAALTDIVQIIVDGKEHDKIMGDIKDFIIEQMNGKMTKNLFRFSEVPDTNMKEYINTIVMKELIEKGNSKEDATAICETLINNPQVRDHIIEHHELDSVRVCEHCGKLMNEGYLVNDFNTYCSEECARAATAKMGWTEEMFNERLADADSEDACIYWTQWER